MSIEEDAQASEVAPSSRRTLRAHLMLDNAPIACTFWDLKGQLLDCNDEALRLFGLSSKQEFMTRYPELVPEFQPQGERSADMIPAFMAEAQVSGRFRFPRPWVRLTAAGEPVPCELTIASVAEDGEPMLVAFLRDLREEQKLQAEKREADERVQLMLDATPLCCTFWDEELRLVDCNEEAVRLFGLRSKQEFLDRFSELSPERQANGERSDELIRRNTQQALREGYLRLEWTHCTLDGKPFPVEVTLVRVQRASGQVIAAYVRDLREINEVLRRIHEANEYNQLMLDAMPLCCNLWDEAHGLIACNDEAVKLYGMKDKQEYLERFFELHPEYQPSGRLSSELAHEYITTSFRDGYARFEWMHQNLQGEPVPAEVTLVRVPRGDDGFIVAGYTRDLRELKQNTASLKRLESLAFTDRLTKTANRHYFTERATAVLADVDPGGPASLLMFDIDHFKRVNDTYGHSAGDAILRDVADRVHKSMRGEDLFARYGGEEFVILLARCRLGPAVALAERVRQVIDSEPFEYQGKKIPITISIGVASSGDRTFPLSDFINQADAALYEAKHRGRNRVEHLDPLALSLSGPPRANSKAPEPKA
jgi:diguanylate cyclase (GGDEF)-like protein/PAS domain S-box-containing protein